MNKSAKINFKTRVNIVEHAIDNGVNSSDYTLIEMLETSHPVPLVNPEPCDLLPRQFGYWFHTGPGFADAVIETYEHKILQARGVKILGNDGVIVYGHGWVDATSIAYARTDLPGCQMRRDDRDLWIAAVARRLDGIYFAGYNAGHANYAHWVTDQLPLVQYYTEHFMDKGVKLILPYSHASFLTQYIDFFGIPAEKIEFIGDEVVEVESLIHSNIFSFDRIPLSAVKLLNRFKEKFFQPLKPPGRKIFLSRRETAARCLLNEEAVVRLLIANGYEIIVPSELSVQEQIELCMDASCVVSVHGAGLANIVFCQPGTRVIEIFPEYTVSSHFWVLASHFSLRYGAVFGTSFDQDRGLTDQMGSWNAPFVIGEQALQRCLDLV